MKKINSIWFAPKLLLIAALSGVALPVLLVVIHRLIREPLLLTLSTISACLGFALFVLLTITLRVELRQDRNAVMNSRKGKSIVLVLNGSRHECQNCGYRMSAKAKDCPVCGVALREAKQPKSVK